MRRRDLLNQQNQSTHTIGLSACNATVDSFLGSLRVGVDQADTVSRIAFRKDQQLLVK